LELALLTEGKTPIKQGVTDNRPNRSGLRASQGPGRARMPWAILARKNWETYGGARDGF